MATQARRHASKLAASGGHFPLSWVVLALLRVPRAHTGVYRTRGEAVESRSTILGRHSDGINLLLILDS